MGIEPRVGLDGREKAGGQRRVDTLEDFQEDEADPVAVGEEPVATGVRQLLDQALGAEFERS